MLKVKFENLGPISKGEVPIKKLTILCGGNNTGKTYASYAIYGLLKELSRLRGEYPSFEKELKQEAGEFEVDLQEMIDRLDSQIESLVEGYSNKLYRIFSTRQEVFANTRVQLDFDKQAFAARVRETKPSTEFHFSQDTFVKIDKSQGVLQAKIAYSLLDKEAIKGENIKFLIEAGLNLLLASLNKQRVFLLPAERSGMNLFFKELNVARNELIHGLGVGLLNDELQEVHQRLEQSISTYAVPISEYLMFLNQLDALSKEESPFKDIAQEIQEAILMGTYEVKDQQIFYRNSAGTPIHLHVSSSTVKSLFGLAFYLTYMARPGKTLIIDEPELNLHPDNQRKLAKVLAKLTNRGLRVIISTHSDYMIKEFNNLLMIAKTVKNRDRLMEQYDYKEEELLSPDDVSANLFIDSRIEAMEIDPVEGIIADTFDQVINRHNEASDDIYYTLQEELNGE